MSMKLTTQQPAYFPALQYFWKIAQSDILILTDHFQFVKRSPLTISARLQQSQPALRLPVRHEIPKSPICEKKFDPNSHWAKKHLHTIHHMFHHTPYAYHYIPVIEELLKSHSQNLADFLSASLIKTCELLHLKVKILRSSKLDHAGGNEQLISNWCGQTNCDSFIADATVFEKLQVNEKTLLKNNISCHEFIPFPEYHILQSNRQLSILHFLFQYGPEAGYLLRQYLPLK